jgi:hypothetical protein
LPLSEKIKRMKEEYKLPIKEDSQGENYGFLDYMFYHNPRLANPSLLTISSKENLESFKKYMTTIIDFRCKTMPNTIDTDICEDFQSNYASNSINLFVKTLTSDTSFVLSLDPIYNNVDLASLTTRNMIITIFYVSADKRMIGQFNLFYTVNDSGVTAKYSIIANSVITKPSSVDEPYWEYYASVCLVLIFIISYVKNIYLGNFNELINRSFFLILFWGVFILENVYKFYHIMNSTNDYVSLQQILKEQRTRDLVIIYLNNIRMIKSLLVLCLSYHLIYVVFTVNDLIVFIIFLKPVFQRFFILIFIGILAFGITTTVFIGGTYLEYNTLYNSFFNVLNYALGVATPLNTDISDLVNDQTKTFFSIFSWLFKVIVFNFTMVTMFYFYKKAHTKYLKSDRKRNK